VCDAAEVDGRGGERELVSGGPEVKLIASGAAGETLVDVPLQIHGEAGRLDGRAVRERAGAADLGTASPRRTKAEQFQDPTHGDLGAEGRVVDRRESGTWHG
jgi:hypothetical protein